MPTPSYPMISTKPSFSSKIKRFLDSQPNNNQQLSKIIPTNYNATEFKQDGEKWLKKPFQFKHEEGKKIIRYIATIIANDEVHIDLSKFKASYVPEELIVKWLSKLQSANFSNCKINDIKFLNKLKCLRDLTLNNCQLKEAKNINLPLLIYLSLANNQLCEFKNCHFPRVQFLNLENNIFFSFQKVKDTFPQIHILNISHNQLKNLIGVSCLINKNLVSIYLLNNPLHTEVKQEILTNTPLLKKCKIYLEVPENNHRRPISRGGRAIIHNLATWQDPSIPTTTTADTFRKVEIMSAGIGSLVNGTMNTLAYPPGYCHARAYR